MLDTDAPVDFVSFPDMLKARPALEGGRRFLYLEASNEAIDYQAEKVMTKALAESADYFLRFGNIDLDHLTQLGPKVEAQTGMSHYSFEIGKPLEVRVDGLRTFVKAEIYSGDAPVAAKANDFWDSLTKMTPPKRWYPSVGGKVLERGMEFDEKGNAFRAIRRVRWTNIGLSQTPVNLHVPEASLLPIGVLSKALGIDFGKTLTAGYGTDSASLQGGGAIRRQSLDGVVRNYWDFRDAMAGHLRKNLADLGDHARQLGHATGQFGLEPAQAAEWLERMHADLRRNQRAAQR